MLKDIFIAGTRRTPWGAFSGSLASLTAPQLGTEAIKACLAKTGTPADQVDRVYMGNVISAGAGQNIARQAALGAGIPKEVPCVTINKVCGSSLQTAIFAAQGIQCGDYGLIVSGGAESMTNAPYLLPKARSGYRMGHGELLDAMIKDGLSDAASGKHMGLCGDTTAAKYDFSRQQQDDYAVESYKRAIQGQADGAFEAMIAPVTLTARRGEVIVDRDEDLAKFSEDKLRSLRPAFGPEGTITAGNASNIDDGAAAMLICDQQKADQLNIPIEARLLGYAGAATDPEWFSIAPIAALKKLSEKLNLKLADVDVFEINEAFSVVALVAMRELKLPHEKVNVLGGAVAIGHPIGATGARLIGTTINALRRTNGKIGVATACLGGGEALAVAVELL